MSASATCCAARVSARTRSSFWAGDRPRYPSTSSASIRGSVSFGAESILGLKGCIASPSLRWAAYQTTRFSPVGPSKNSDAPQQAADGHGFGGGEETIGWEGVGAIDDDLAMIGQAEPLVAWLGAGDEPVGVDIAAKRSAVSPAVSRPQVSA